MTVLLLHSGARARVATAALEAFRAIDAVMQAQGYAPRAADTGGFNCRKITGGSGYSLHAYGIAVDYNWNSNPYRADGKLITDMPKAMVDAIKAIRTTKGVQVFRWGGDYQRVKDSMHFEVVASPRELDSGIDWSRIGIADPDPKRPSSWPVLERGARGPSVEELQRRLTEAGHPCGPADGIYGSATEKAVRAYQKGRALDVDGVVGLQVWTALLTDQPPTPAERSPVKVRDRATTSHEPTAPPICKRGSRGKAVTRLQKRLGELGFDCGPADGRFGPNTERVVRDFQAARGLETDGIVGPQTWGALLAG
jgi:peptidoglycan hydrolase-like protein with peptidoglycan-binding domain